MVGLIRKQDYKSLSLRDLYRKIKCVRDPCVRVPLCQPCWGINIFRWCHGDPESLHGIRIQVYSCSEFLDPACNLSKISGDTHTFARLAAALMWHIFMTLKVFSVFSYPSLEFIWNAQAQGNFSRWLLGSLNVGASFQSLPLLHLDESERTMCEIGFSFQRSRSIASVKR
jgi:hypothetical protein